MRPTDAARPAVPPDVELRRAVDEDADEVAGLYLATRRAAVPAMPAQIHDEEDVRRHVARAIAEREVWVAEAGEVLGFATLTGAWLDSLYVGPAQQGTGIGSMLLDLAKARRPDGFSLWVFASNSQARGFYRRRGLIELEHTDGSGNEERAADLRMAWPGRDPLGFLRRQIDEVDEELAVLLARRFALAAAVQAHKPTPGHEGRDTAREREIAERMAAHAPGLDVARVARVMDVVIAEGLDAWRSGR